MTRKRVDLFLTTLLFLMFIGAIYGAMSFPWQASIAPIFACVCGAFFAAIQLWNLTMRKDEGVELANYNIGDLIGICWFLSFIGCVVILGFFWGGLIAVFTYVLLNTKGEIVTAILASLPIVIIFWAQEFLELYLYRGILNLPVPF